MRRLSHAKIMDLVYPYDVAQDFSPLTHDK